MRRLTPALLIALSLSIPGAAQLNSPAAASVCAPMGVAHTRTTLYFGLAHPAGTVSEKQWRKFLREQVTPRFPNGFTVWQADGQWQNANGRISRERAKVLLLVHEESSPVRQALIELVQSYKRAFRQESVLWETAAVCAAF